MTTQRLQRSYEAHGSAQRVASGEEVERFHLYSLVSTNDVQAIGTLLVGIVHTLHDLKEIPCAAFGLLNKDLED